jgi:hypothetical protein
MTATVYAEAVIVDGRPGLRLDPMEWPVTDPIIKRAAAKHQRIRVTIDLESGRASNLAMNRLYFRLLGILYEAINGERPTQEEKEAFHEDFKAAHGLRRPSKLVPGELVPIGLSERDYTAAHHLIEEAFQEIGQMSMAKADQGITRELWFDYWQAGGPAYLDETDFRARATLCAACGRGGAIELCHMTSRGASPDREDDPGNWIPLCHDHHMEQHRVGVKSFLDRYPHLKNRWNKARGGAGK